MAKSVYKDHFGMAVAGFEHTLRKIGKEKSLTPAELIAKQEKDAIARIKADKEREERNKAEKEAQAAKNPRMGNIWRSEYEAQVKQFAHEKEHGKPRAKKEAAPIEIDESIQILSALYGIESVTIEIKDRVCNGRKVNNRLAGEDPVPGKKKSLVVKAMVDGVEVEKTFGEGQVIELR